MNLRNKLPWLGFSLIFLGLLITKPVNLSHLIWDLPRGGEFFGWIGRVADISLLAILSSYAVLHCRLLNLEEPLNNRQWQILKLTKIILLILGGLSFMTYWTSLHHFLWPTLGPATLRGLAVTATCIFILDDILGGRDRFWKWLIFLPYFVFDHIILTNSVATLLLVCTVWMIRYQSPNCDSQTAAQSRSQLPDLTSPVQITRLESHDQLVTGIHKFTRMPIITYGVMFILALNLGVSLYQLGTGHSLGLYWLGEVNLNVNQSGGIAKQAFFGVDYLRGYGLMPHPNILGLLGVAGCGWARLAQYPSGLGRNTLVWLYCLAGATLATSMSRMAWLSLLFFVGTWSFKLLLSPTVTYQRFHWSYFWGRILGATLLVLVIGNTIFNPAKTEADSYRLDQHQYWLSILRAQPQSLLLGVGPGQYSSSLQQLQITKASWQNEPIHNPILLFLTEWGILWIVLIWILIVRFQYRN